MAGGGQVLSPCPHRDSASACLRMAGWRRDGLARRDGALLATPGTACHLGNSARCLRDGEQPTDPYSARALHHFPSQSSTTPARLEGRVR